MIYGDRDLLVSEHVTGFIALLVSVPPLPAVT